MQPLNSLPDLAEPATSRSTSVDSAGPVTARARRGKLRREGQKWTRWLHVYSSMIALLVVLFFAATGITLNHPEWTFGLDPVAESFSGTLPDAAVSEDGSVDFLVVNEYLRSEYGVDGEVSDYGVDATGGSISYRGPGYGADVFFDLETGEYQLTVEQQGLIAVLNDLHKGRDTASSWNWLIDASGVFLVVIALTGLGLQLFLSKRRRVALTVAGIGTLITLTLVIVAVT